MSSARFPGKVLAPFKGKPIISHVLERLAEAIEPSRIIVLTSNEPTDDPLAYYLRSKNVAVFRGPLQDVFTRFRLCLLEKPCEWFLRISADSPLFDPGILPGLMQATQNSSCDLVTTIFPRTFPKGQNAELVRTSTFLTINPSALSPHEREHVTPFFYNNSTRFRIVNVTSNEPRHAELSLAVDTIEDLHRLESLDSVPPFKNGPADRRSALERSAFSNNVRVIQ